MQPIQTKSENPTGLHQRYKVEKIEGPKDPRAEYFVFRLDKYGDDLQHIKACRKAIEVYAKEMSATMPGLSVDLLSRYPVSELDNKINYKASKNPVDTISQMFFDMYQAESLLLQVSELPMFQEIFKPGELCSVREIISKLNERRSFTKQLLETLQS